MNPKYPVYIISKGRADVSQTSIYLTKINVPHSVVIEPQEYDEYKKYIDKRNNIIVLPFSNLGQGSIPARNFVFEHSINQGAKKHWIMDDNIRHFWRFNKNTKIKISSGTIFKCAEDFTDRYINVKMSGLNYDYFAPASQKLPPFYLNIRIYSCILLSNDISHRWRGKYNEDTDLSLRVLKNGYCTILFNSFLAGKTSTQVLKGGNTDNVYIDGDNRYKFAKSLKDQHPDCVKIVWRYNRWHHEVDYRRFKTNKLIFDPNYKKTDNKINEYGMKLKSK